MAANQSLDELFRLYLERTLTANAIGGPGSQDVTVTNVATSPVPVDLVTADMDLLAKESTLELLRAQAAAINANTDAVEALLTTIRDEQQRRTDPLPAGSNILGFVSPTPAKKISEGKVWLAGRKEGVSLTSTTASIAINNPGSPNTKNVHIFHFNVSATVGGEAQFFHGHAADTTSNLNTFGSAVTAMNPNHFFDAATPTAVVRAGAGQPTGVDIRSPIRRTAGSLDIEFDGLIILPPGHSFGLTVGGATGDGVFYMNARWYEE